jgi:lysophospholipase L1-like esterase
MSRIILLGSVLFALAGVVGTFALRLEHVGSLANFMSKALLSAGTLGVLASLFVKRILGVERADRLFLNLTISLISLTLLLIITEFAVRFAFRDVTTTADNISYFARRWEAEKVRINNWGFREREFAAAKPESMFRIAVIGDSYTYGQGIDERERFTNLLEEQLTARSGRHEVLNFGRLGAETVDHLKILTDQVVGVRPDFIILQWFTNDVEGNDKGERPRPLKLLPSDFLISKLNKVSALYYLLNQQWITLQNRLGWLGSYEDYMITRFGNPSSASSLAAKEAFQNFINVCKNREVPLGVVLFSYRSSSLAFLTERVLDICAQEAITCIDLRDAFAPYNGDPRLWANRLDPHAGPLANRLAADRLVEAFEKIWFANSYSAR